MGTKIKFGWAVALSYDGSTWESGRRWNKLWVRLLFWTMTA